MSITTTVRHVPSGFSVEFTTEVHESHHDALRSTLRVLRRLEPTPPVEDDVRSGGFPPQPAREVYLATEPGQAAPSGARTLEVPA